MQSSDVHGAKLYKSLRVSNHKEILVGHKKGAEGLRHLLGKSPNKVSICLTQNIQRHYYLKDKTFFISRPSRLSPLWPPPSPPSSRRRLPNLPGDIFLTFFLKVCPQVRAFEPKKWRRLGPSTWSDKVKCCIIKRSQKSCFYCQPARQPRPPETHRQPRGDPSRWQIGPADTVDFAFNMRKDPKTTKVEKYILLQLFSIC